MLPIEGLFQLKDKYRLKVKWWKIILQANSIQRKVIVAMHISNKIDFKIKGNKSQRWTFYDNGEDNLSRRHNTYQYICNPILEHQNI